MRKFLQLSVGLILSLAFHATHVTGYSLRSETSYNTTTLGNVVIHTPSQRVYSSAEFNITFSLEGHQKPLKLALTPNHDILSQNPHIQYLDANGQPQHTELMKRHHHRVFKGSVLLGSEINGWERAGWTRISIVRDGTAPLFDGAFSVWGVQYNINIDSNRMLVSHTSHNDTPTTQSNRTHSTKPHFAATKRQFTFDSPDLIDTIGSTDGCPTSRQIALVGIATDCVYTGSFSSSEDLVDSVVSMVNTASEVFESTFNIALALHNLTIEEEQCPTIASSDLPWNVGCSAGDLNWRLERFTSWREQSGGSENAYWTLLSGCPTGTAVGVSWVGELCNDELSANVVALADNQWQVFAHESAHTFGAYHDCDSSTCSRGQQCCPFSASTCDADGQYIMNAISTGAQTEFSPCTVGNVCSAMDDGRVDTQCLTTNSDTPTISAGECGNGVVEVGEDCDCGDDCDGNPCCDGSTCRFLGDAVCDDAEGSCCRDCQFASSGTVCRASVGECDIEETCSGDDAACPSDRHEDDGQSCGSESESDLFCSSGQCTSRDLQCQGQVQGDNSTISSCGDSTCALECSSPWGGAGSCSRVGDVLDGTPCDGGLCRGGQCRSRSEDDDSGESWVQENLSLVIGLSAGIGGLLLLAVLSSIVYCCCCRRRPKKVPNQLPLPLPPIAGYAPPPYSPRPAVPQTPYYRYA
ncbi:ADAM family of metalloprotease ADM-A [Aspergillus lucknowensis]|uniref:Metallo-peptidase family M12-domain-containing protein n=1 Tax=Aspergillus lucknowensis TaxID=176173 RepID=A0ABR4LMZ8_9EURO